MSPPSPSASSRSRRAHRQSRTCQTLDRARVRGDHVGPAHLGERTYADRSGGSHQTSNLTQLRAFLERSHESAEQSC